LNADFAYWWVIIACRFTALHCMKEFMTVDGNKVVYENVIEQESQRIFFSKIVYMKIVLLFHSCVLNDIKNTKILMSI
jgi:hypothetical protein